MDKKKAVVAVVQAAPVVFNVRKTLYKVESKSQEAAERDAQLVLFPEAFIGAYSRGLSFGPNMPPESALHFYASP